MYLKISLIDRFWSFDIVLILLSKEYLIYVAIIKKTFKNCAIH